MCREIKKHEKHTYVTTRTLVLLKKKHEYKCFINKISYSTLSSFVIIIRNGFEEKKEMTMDMLVNL